MSGHGLVGYIVDHNRRARVGVKRTCQVPICDQEPRVCRSCHEREQRVSAALRKRIAELEVELRGN